MTPDAGEDGGERTELPLPCRRGAAFRWRPTRLPGEPHDVLRVVQADGVTLALLANGYECGFSACWPPASRLVLDLFVDAWAAASGPARGRLEVAFREACRLFVEQAPPLVAPDADFPDEMPSAILLAVVVEGRRVHVLWVGGDVAALVRGGRVVAETTPHTLVETFRREHPEETDVSHVPNVLVRSILCGAPEQAPPDHLAFTIERGDTLLLLSRAVFRGPCVPLDDAARAAVRHGDPTALAEHLAEAGFTSNDTPYAAVIALRFDDTPPLSPPGQRGDAEPDTSSAASPPADVAPKRPWWRRLFGRA